MTSTAQKPTTDKPVNGSNRLLFVAFMLGAFALGTSENIMSGILPNVASSLSVSVATAGLLVTAYAATVVVAGPILALLLGKVELRKTVLLALTVYLAGSLLAAISHIYVELMAARIITGLVHTTVLVTFMATAMRVSAPERQATAASTITLGMSAATVLGVPVGVFVAQHLAWQWSFVIISALTLISLAVVYAKFPRDGATEPTSGVQSLRILLRRNVVLGILTTAFIGMGALVVMIYSVPILTDGAGISSKYVAWILILFGLGCIAGNSVGAKIADRSLPIALVTTIGFTAAAILALGTFAEWKIAAVALFTLVGFGYFATFPALNTWVASNAADLSPGLALAFNSSAFNVGIALAGVIGSWYISSGAAISRLPLAGLVPAVISLAIAAVIWATTKKSATAQ